jgi:hypothetical protein
MKGQIATGYVPYEPGDFVKLKRGEAIWKVVEIRLTQYVVAKTAEFHLKLIDESDGTTIWRAPDKIEKRIIETSSSK